MRPSTFIAIAMMCMWITGEANAQQDTPTDGSSSGQQVDGVEGQKRSKGQRAQGRRGNGRRQGNQQGSRRAGGAQFIGTLFRRFDTDKNGSISLAEAPDRMKPRFANIDTNGDKAVSKEELEAAFAKIGQRRAGKDGNGKKGADKKGAGKKGAGKTKGNDGQRQQRDQRQDPVKLIERLDRNNDGVLSVDEVPEKMKQRFDRVDTDSSGSVTAEELKSAYEKRGKGGQVGRNKSANPDATKPIKPKRPPMVKEDA